MLEWGLVLITAYTGFIGAFLYVLGCREPLPGLHEQYVANRWRQTLGSTMHCVAGDGLGILAGAVIGAVVRLSKKTNCLRGSRDRSARSRPPVPSKVISSYFVLGSPKKS